MNAVLPRGFKWAWVLAPPAAFIQMAFSLARLKHHPDKMGTIGSNPIMPTKGH
jgi:hypothetical protein